MRVAGLKVLALAVLGLSSLQAVAQIPAAFRLPVVGYLHDSGLHAIRPVTGILGSARLGAPIDLDIPVVGAAFLPDQRHAIVSVSGTGEALVVDLEQPSQFVSIAGAPASVSMIRISRDGTSAGLLDTANSRLLIVGGLPAEPVVREGIDLAFTSFPLADFAIANGGNAALLVFRSAGEDQLYAWVPPTGTPFVSVASRVSGMAFMGEDAVVADSGADRVILIRSVRGQAAPVVIADSSVGVHKPVAINVSDASDIYVGNGDTVLVMNASGDILRKAVCSCAITAVDPLGKSAFRLTGSLHEPVFVLDETALPGRILFIPALSPSTPQ